MNKLLCFSRLTLALLLASVFIFSSCKKEEETETYALENIIFEDSTVSLAISQKYSISVTYEPSNATNKTLEWTSLNEDVVTVSSGQLTAVGEGETIVYAESEEGGYTDSCLVTVPAGTVMSSLGSGSLTFLTYNLGATDSDPLGSLYQWGRNSDGHESRTSAVTATLSSSEIPAHGDFILSSEASFGDWISPLDELFFNTRWDTIKTANDPCPEGYRIPTVDEWESVLSDNTWTQTDDGFKISPDGGSNYTLFLPNAGKRYFEDGSVVETGVAGYYWSSSPKNTDAFNLSLQGKAALSRSSKANGLSVRCVKE